MLDSAPAWLFYPVPLWAFLLAILTTPARWAGYAKRVMKKPFGGGPGE